MLLGAVGHRGGRSGRPGPRRRRRAGGVAAAAGTEANRRDLGAIAGTGVAATSTAAWLAAGQHLTRGEAGRQVRLAAELDTRFERVRAALAAGRLSLERAQVIVAALERLPRELGDKDRARAETYLVEQADIFGPDELRVLGRRLFEVIDPAGADAEEGRLLEAEERAARAKARLWMQRLGDGSTRGGFSLPDAQADMLKVALDALVSPRSPRPGDETEPLIDPDLDQTRLPYDQRLGHAFGELIEHLPVDQLPQSGRSTPRVVVEIGLQWLIHGLGAGTLSTGTRISAASSDCSTTTSGSPWAAPSTAASPTAATDPPPGAKPTTAPPGRTAAAPTWTTASCCAAGTTT